MPGKSYSNFERGQTNAQRIIILVALLLVGVTMSGCSLESLVDKYPEARAVAEGTAAYWTYDMATRFGELALSLSPGSMTVDSLFGVSLAKWDDSRRDYQPVNPNYTPEVTDGMGASPSLSSESLASELIYALDSEQNVSSVGFFLHSTGKADLYVEGTQYADVFGCATLTLTYVTQTVTVTDQTCPSWLVAAVSTWPEVSLSGVTEKQFGQSPWPVTPFVEGSIPYMGNPLFKGVVPCLYGCP